MRNGSKGSRDSRLAPRWCGFGNVHSMGIAICKAKHYSQLSTIVPPQACPQLYFVRLARKPNRAAVYSL